MGRLHRRRTRLGLRRLGRALGRLVGLARDAGALSALPFALNSRAGLHLVEGEPILADSLAKEAAAVNEATGSSIAPYGAVALVAFRGREAEASERIEAARVEVLRRGEGAGLTFVLWASAVLYNGLGRYEDALAAAVQAREDSNAAWFRTWGLVELVEAAARCGKRELAVDALDRLSQTTAASGTDWALGVEARSRALVTEGDAAEPLYRQAIEALERTPFAWSSPAHTSYTENGCDANAAGSTRASSCAPPTNYSRSSAWKAFAERARIELEATGEHARKRTIETRDDLTPQETQISRLAADGATNQEIAAQLFISPSTVDYHLRKAFRKLGVKSRHQLKQHLLQRDAHA